MSASQQARNKELCLKIASLEAQLDEAHKEIEEQCKLHSLGGEREYVLLGKLEQEARRSGQLEARISVVSDLLKQERARHEMVVKGGQTCGDTSRRMTITFLHELERALGEDQGRYTYEYYLKMVDTERELREKIKNQAERIRVLEGVTNHAGGLVER